MTVAVTKHARHMIHLHMLHSSSPCNGFDQAVRYVEGSGEEGNGVGKGVEGKGGINLYTRTSKVPFGTRAKATQQQERTIHKNNCLYLQNPKQLKGGYRGTMAYVHKLEKEVIYFQLQ